MFFVWGMMILVSSYAVIGNAKQCVLDLDSSATLMATLSVIVISVCNGLGRLILGTAYDKLGRMKTMTINSLMIMVSSILLISAFQTGSVLLMIIGFILVGFAYGGVPPTSSAFIADFFGTKNYSLKFGVVTLYIFIGAFGSTLAGLIKDSAGSFENLFYVLIGLGIIAFLLNFSIGKQKRTVMQEKEEMVILEEVS